MTISYPLSLPASRGIRSIAFAPASVVGISESPFTFEQQAYQHFGERWSARIDLVPMERDEAEPWIAFLLSLKGRYGTFLLGDPAGATAQGTWAGSSPVVNGAHAARSATLNVRNLPSSAQWAAGDWLQLGSGSSARLHKVLAAGGPSGSPSEATLDLWPRTRTTYADGDAITIASAKGVFRLAGNQVQWSIEEINYGLSFECVEAL